MTPGLPARGPVGGGINLAKGWALGLGHRAGSPGVQSKGVSGCGSKLPNSNSFDFDPSGGDE